MDAGVNVGKPAAAAGAARRVVERSVVRRLLRDRSGHVTLQVVEGSDASRVQVGSGDACVTCRRQHRKCDDHRPCASCLTADLGASCRSAPSDTIHCLALPPDASAAVGTTDPTTAARNYTQPSEPSSAARAAAEFAAALNDVTVATAAAGSAEARAAAELATAERAHAASVAAVDLVQWATRQLSAAAVRLGAAVVVTARYEAVAGAVVQVATESGDLHTAIQPAGGAEDSFNTVGDEVPCATTQNR